MAKNNKDQNNKSGNEERQAPSREPQHKKDVGGKAFREGRDPNKQEEQLRNNRQENARIEKNYQNPNGFKNNQK